MNGPDTLCLALSITTKGILLPFLEQLLCQFLHLLCIQPALQARDKIEDIKISKCRSYTCPLAPREHRGYRHGHRPCYPSASRTSGCLAANLLGRNCFLSPAQNTWRFVLTSKSIQDICAFKTTN